MEAEEHLNRLRDLLRPEEERDLIGLQRRIEALERASPASLRPLHAMPVSDEEQEERLLRTLQPQMGRILRGSATHALHRLGARTNSFVDALLSWRLMKLRLKAIITGQSMRELVESELCQTEVRRLYLVLRDEGTLLFHWSNADFVEEPDEETLEEIMTTTHVMTEFSPERRAMPLREIRLSKSTMLVQASSRYVVAAEILNGIVTEERKEIFSHAFRMVFHAAAAHRGAEADAETLTGEVVTAFAGSLVSQQKERPDRRTNPAYIIALLAILGGVSWYGWRTYHQMQITRTAAAIEQTVLRSFRPGDVVVEVDADRAARRIAVTGLGFGPGSAAQIERRAHTLAQPYALDFNLVMRDLDGARLERDALAASLSDARIALAAARDEMARMDARPAMAMARSPVSELREWVQGNAIFFGEGVVPRDKALMDRQLDTLAGLLNAAPESRLRIEGFTGGDNRIPDRARMANARALVVANGLTARGIGSRRLNPMGGHRPFPAISARTGPGSPNERVEFSLAFTGE